jgi:hypothetical protein
MNPQLCQFYYDKLLICQIEATQFVEKQANTVKVMNEKLSEHQLESEKVSELIKKMVDPKYSEAEFQKEIKTLNFGDDLVKAFESAYLAIIASNIAIAKLHVAQQMCFTVFGMKQ